MFAQEKTVYSIKKKKAFKFRISFITLTLSTAQQHSDTYILHKLLFPFLKYLERKHEVTAYIWRAEIQGKRLKQRGERCIHFHITTDKFIHWRQIRNKWNALQLAHGYKEPGTDPNSTDVHSVRNTESIIGYMTKYFSKQVKDSEEKVTCKIFGMSRNLSLMKCILREEEQNEYATETQQFLYDHATSSKQTDYGIIFYHSLTMNSKVPREIHRQFKENYEAFTKGIISKRRFEVE